MVEETNGDNDKIISLVFNSWPWKSMKSDIHLYDLRLLIYMFKVNRQKQVSYLGFLEIPDFENHSCTVVQKL